MTRFFIALPVAAILAVLNVGLAVGPALAAENACESTLPAEIRAAVATVTDERDQRRALRNLSIGEKLCDAGNERAAGKKFAEALRVLGVSETELAQR